MKKYILGLFIALAAPVMFAYASTPVFTATGAGDNNVTVQVTRGEINAPVVLFYNQSAGGNVQQQNIGSTDINGNFTGTVNTTSLGASLTSPVYVQVGGYQSLPVNWPTGTAASSANAITFTPTYPTFTTGQNGIITISGGGNGTYYVSSIANPNWTSASISGNTLTVTGTQAGQGNVTVCSTAGPCAVINPTFTLTTSTSTTTGTVGAPTLSQSSISLQSGAQGSVTISGGTTPYRVSVLSGNNVNTTLIGNTLYVTGSGAGATLLNICSYNTSNTGGDLCTPVTVNVASSTSSTGTGSTSSGNLSFTLPLSSGEALRLSLSGGSGSYYVQPMSTTPVSATLNGNFLTLTGMAQGATTVNVCSSGTSTCLPIMVTVGPALNGTGGGYFFDTNLYMGMSGQDVLELQNRLHDEGFLNVTPTGYFGQLTASAVRAYQASHGLPMVGIVGPQTRALLNQ